MSTFMNDVMYMCICTRNIAVGFLQCTSLYEGGMLRKTSVDAYNRWEKNK